jgi:hypothetical protein
VEVLTAGRLAPNDVLVGFHVEDANGALAIDWLAVAGVVITVEGGVVMVVVMFAFGSACNGRVCEYRGKFFGEEGSLVAKVWRGFEDDDQGICRGSVSAYDENGCSG